MKMMKRVGIGSVLMLGLSSTVIAQSSTSVGIFGGITSSHTDATPDKTAEIYGITAQYDPIRFAGLKLTLAKGTLTAGEGNSTDMHYTNKFLQADLMLKFMPIRIFESNLSKYPAYHYVSNIYVAGGAGIMRSNTEINYLSSNVFHFQGNYQGTDVLFPVEAGIEIPIYPASKKGGVSLNLGYRTLYFLTDKMDGYDPNLPSNKSKDRYNAFIAGLNYRF